MNDYDMINHGMPQWELPYEPFKPRLELLARIRAKKQGGY